MAVLVGVVLTSFLGVVNGMDLMTLGHMRVVTGALMIAGVVMIGCGSMVAGSVLVMFGGSAVVLSA